MKEVKTETGTLRFNRNLAIIATAGCLVAGTLIGTGNIAIPVDPFLQGIGWEVMGFCSIFPASIAYKNHKQLKKRK